MTRLAIGLRFPAVLLAIVAFWVGRRRLEIWCVAMPILAVTVVHTVFFSTARFTFPAEPPLLVLAALGAAEESPERWGFAGRWCAGSTHNHRSVDCGSAPPAGTQVFPDASRRESA